MHVGPGARGTSSTLHPISRLHDLLTDLAINPQGLAIGKEARAHGANYFAGVCINLGYSPLWGRMQESYGEDPLLIGSMGSALSRGAGHNTLVCAKHFALNSMENLRFQVDVQCAEDVLHECFLPHFRQCLDEGGAESIMSAYNSVNGDFCGDSSALLNGVIRDVWGYEDVTVTSDWMWGSRNAVQSVKAGLDIEMPLQSTRSKFLPKALEKGEIDWTPIDRIGRRLLKMQLKHYVKIHRTITPTVKEVVGCDDHRQLAREASSQGMVLLKNSIDATSKPLLPLDPKQCRKLLVIGALAKSTQTGDGGSSNLIDPTTISPLEGLKGQSDVEVTYLDGSNMSAIEEASNTADAIFVLVGYTSVEEGEYVATFGAETLASTLPYIFPYHAMAQAFSFVVNGAIGMYEKVRGKLPGGDRRDLRLRPKDERMIGEIAQFAGEKMILGVEASGPVVIPRSTRERAAAILFTGYGGCRFGTALRDVLFGQSEPGGRLAYSIVESEADLINLDMSAKSVVYDRYWGYRLQQRDNKRPAYPFGFGLGYGDVRINEGSFEVQRIFTTRFFDVQVMVRNTGPRPSSTVVQIYAGRTNDRQSDDYERVLVGFARTQLIPVGQEMHVNVRCRLDPVAHFNTATKVFEVKEGRYRISASRFEGDEASLNHYVSIEESIAWSVDAKLKRDES
jgi:beta-glucosidase